ncbi:ABC transporter substrate-binding protein [Lactococcus formosensis]|uniref:ABC transporter substrate-binding protein n=1 Tax=Lactococcus formosensis TaxID=1281486 RepID=A0A9X4SDU7_9LACT|nr:ABC transporter substrate-binding protein [Lactococcus formosensis]MDG6126970.1 ABC transporter substrate-binding protein [Lactococcus formosensis]MDG6133259.1 ABC transporter substrate-binding protein [Lactococcus formosensis]MDG6135254.1 ABC transporter substrate-binding protein [Lactococcus formosensis]MDG6141311.1 ABC transporter substrate-binding protein [Lactococcus formosensis]MDG6145378.1 ABC transporter substrate-binding protein [Lactococcus formosensis]
MKKKILTITALLFIIVSLSSCANNNHETQEENQSKVEITTPQGEKIKVPNSIQRVVSLSPAVTQIIDDLGQKDKLIAVDTQSPKYVSGLEKVQQTDLMNLDFEKIMALKPELLFVSDLTMFQSEDKIKKLQDKGTAVVVLPTEKNFKEIESNICLVATALNQKEKGEQLAGQLEKDITAFREQATRIKQKKRVLFEIAASPEIYSMGKDTYVNEMIETIGAENVMAKETGAIKVSEEAAIMSNPDVILTNVEYVPDPIHDILKMKGWEEVEAVKNKTVYSIDNEKSSLPNQHIVQAMREMAKAVYPDEFKNFK